MSFHTRTHPLSPAAPSSTTATPPKKDLPTWSVEEVIQSIVPLSLSANLLFRGRTHCCTLQSWQGGRRTGVDSIV